MAAGSITRATPGSMAGTKTMGKHFRIFVAALPSCLALTSCSSPPAITQNDSPVGYVALVAARDEREAEREIQAHASVGETIRLWGHLNFSGNCQTVAPTNVRVVRAPQHGTLSLGDEEVTLTNPELGANRECKGATGMGKVVYYTRTSEGVDVFAYDSVSLNGVIRVQPMIADTQSLGFPTP
jgi:hypothetical protein